MRKRATALSPISVTSLGLKRALARMSWRSAWAWEPITWSGPRAGPRRLAGVDLTPRAVAWTTQRLATYGFTSEVERSEMPSTSPSPMTRSTSSTPGACSTTHRTRRRPSVKLIAYSGQVAHSER